MLPIVPSPDRTAVAEAHRILREARRIVVLAGAGISTDSGIPDFRGPDGVWTKNPSAERLSTLQDYLASSTVRRAAWQSRLQSPLWEAAPTAGHRALVDLERDGRLDLLVTQNIDGLHHAAGNDPDRVIEIHGSAHQVVCMTCGHHQPTTAVLERVRAGVEDPRCEELSAGGRACAGILKTTTISFGENLVASDLARAEAAAAGCQVLLAVGTSLAVRPAAGLVPTAVRAGARLVIVNAEPTPFDEIADAVVREPIGAVLPELVGR